MKKFRVIQFSIREARQAIQSNQRLEAMAFALMVKTNYTSSLLKGKHTTKQHLKTRFKIGHAKLTRCLNNGVRFGYLRWENGNIIANKLYSENGQVFRYTIEGIQENKSIKYYERLITSATFIQHVNKVTKRNNRIKRQKSRKGFEDTRLANKRCGEQSYYLDGINYGLAGAIINKNRQSTIRLIKWMQDNNLIIKREVLELFPYKINDYKSDQSNLRLLNIHIRKENGKVYQQFANYYEPFRPKLIKSLFSKDINSIA